MQPTPTRRDLLTKAAPAAALAMTAFGSMHALAQAGGDAGGNNAMQRLLAQAFADGEYKLPPLPYDYNALEPHIDEQTMRLHHDKHHQAYVNGLNKALATLRQTGGDADATTLSALQRDLSFNGGGHIMHTVFWATMGPNAGGAPQGEIAQAIEAQYGSFDGFKRYFTTAASLVKGSGWAVLCYEPMGDNLVVFSLNEHDTKLIAGCQPLLPLDVWEHAYYLKYQNNRGAYINAWWNVVNWAAVNDLYTSVRQSRGV